MFAPAIARLQPVGETIPADPPHDRGDQATPGLSRRERLSCPSRLYAYPCKRFVTRAGIR